MSRASHWICVFTAAALLRGAEPVPRKLVQFTMVAMDGKGKPIADLREDELSITEDGQPRAVAAFRFEGGAEAYRPPCARGFFTNGGGCREGLPPNIVETAPDSSLGSLESLAAHLAALPGRKSIVWKGAAGMEEEQILFVSQRLATLGVSVYPLAGAHADLVAKVTGGRVVESADQGLAVATSDLAGAYSIGFFDVSEADNQWHAITVTARRRGALLTYRQGYQRKKPVNRDWTDSQWSNAISESLTGATLPVDARCELVPGRDSAALTCTLLIPDSKLGLLPAEDHLRGEIETALVEKSNDGRYQVQQARSAFRVSAGQFDALDSHATQLVGHWKIGRHAPLLRLVVRDCLSANYAALDLAIDKIPPPGTPGEETAPAPPPGADPFIEQAREVALAFLKSLPNYVVKENLARERQTGSAGLWGMKDRIVAEVVYEAGKETMRDATLNGQPATIAMLEETGTWSTGQFAGTLKALFDRQSNAVFHERGAAKIGGREARVYDYSIERVNSAWMLTAGAKTYVTAYHGTVWLERDTGRTLRFEMKARGIPNDFPFNRAESSTSFGMVHIGNTPYLMPESSVALVCTRAPDVLSAMRRGSRTPMDACARNVIQFTGYRQFGVESNISFGPGH